LVDGNWLTDCLGVKKGDMKTYIRVFKELYNTSEKPFTWDYQLGLCCYMNGSHNIVPNVNMVSNIGFGIGESHSNAGKNVCSDNPIEPITFPLVHPAFYINDTIYDRKTFKFLFQSTLAVKLSALFRNPVGAISRKVKQLRLRV
jgi:hypothetical protein